MLPCGENENPKGNFSINNEAPNLISAIRYNLPTARGNFVVLQRDFLFIAIYIAALPNVHHFKTDAL